MAIQLSLSADQAALLLPILQQITEKGGPAAGQAIGASDSSQSMVLNTDSARVHATFGMPYTPETVSSTDLESDSASSSGSKFKLEELLVRKGKNMKSSDAQNFLLVSIKAAAAYSYCCDHTAYG